MNSRGLTTFALMLTAGLALVGALMLCLNSSATRAQETGFPSPTSPQAHPSTEAIQATAASTVEVWLTNGNDENVRLQQQSNTSFSSGSGSNPLQIQVTEIVAYQQMDGFGAALTDSAAWVISNTSDITRTKVLSDLFSPTDGIGISYLRLPMGATDFTPVMTDTGFDIIYTYDDNNNQPDPYLTNFSIARDDADHYNRIPVISEAKSLNPQLKVMGSPWTAPAWMKDNGSPMLGTLLSSHQITYANYFTKFVQAYKGEGIPIHAVTIQNEPYHVTTTYPTMWMEPWQQAEFVRELGRAFEEANITETKILVWDHNWDRWDYPLDVLSDEEAKSYIAGSAWHCYACNPRAQTSVHNAYPEKDIYFTECTGHYTETQEPDGDFSKDLVWGVQNVAIGATRNWAKTVLYWNLALGLGGDPSLPGACGKPKTKCRGLVTISPTGTIDYHAEYYIIGHLSKFVTPGAYRIGSNNDESIETVAFRNPDKSKVLIALNSSENETQTFDVQWNGQHFSYTLPPQSVVTFKWSGEWSGQIRKVYLPLVLRAYPFSLPPMSFQNFEPGNGTPGDYYREAYRMTCNFENTIVHSGNRSLRCRAPDQGDVHGGTVSIYPSSSPVDLSSAATISVWVYDAQGCNTVELKLCDTDYCLGESAVWSRDQAIPCKWTKITWPLSVFTSTDKSNIIKIELYEWNNGIYYFDDITYE